MADRELTTRKIREVSEIGPVVGEAYSGALSKIDAAGVQLDLPACKQLLSCLEGYGSSELDTLNLAYCFMGLGGANALVDAMDGNSALTDLDVQVNNFCDSGVAALVPLLSRPNCPLLKLHLGVNSLGVRGAIALAGALQSNSTLQYLNLWGNELEAAGVQAIAHAVGAPHSSLTGKNQPFLPSSPSLSVCPLNHVFLPTALDVGGNGLGNSGGVWLAQTLKSARSLCSLSGEYITVPVPSVPVPSPLSPCSLFSGLQRAGRRRAHRYGRRNR
jgi:hypothetical protein